MAGSTISGKVTATVTLGSASYPSPLTVATTGDVAVTAAGAIGIYGPAGSGTVINGGTVIGGTGGAASVGSGAGTGGVGIELLSGATLANDDAITGGTGGSGGSGFEGSFGPSNAGGIGVDLLSGSTATNNSGGIITGGTGGTGGFGGGDGGVGAYLGTGAGLTNLGTVTGGIGGLSGDELTQGPGLGGAGVVVDGGSLTNSGTIAGGYGLGALTFGGEGGRGVSLLAGTLINTGTIIGGGANTATGTGAAGVYLAGSATLRNSGGTIIGGQGGGTGIDVAAGGSLTIAGVVIGGAYGGVGVALSDGGSLDNIGTVIGGIDNNGIGIELAKGGTLTNAATIIGGAGIEGTGGGTGGGSGVTLAEGGVVLNTGFIAGGVGTMMFPGVVSGGAGVGLNAGTLTNDANATITGGASPYGGGIGVSLTIATLTNAGTVTGGAGGNGGTGVSLTDNAFVTNTGSIGGGDGGFSSGERGGGGVVFGASSSASTLDNSGRITGGNGADVVGSNALTSGSIVGGDGAYVGSGDTLTNSGTIIGGSGIYVGAGGAFVVDNNGTVIGGDGAIVAGSGTLINTGGTIISGVGVYLGAGGTLKTDGTIAGGVYAGVTADAVLFAAAGTLVIDPGASFIGQVVGNASATDSLYLANYNSTTGTLSGLGTQFVNFSQITVGSDATWTLTGANTVASGATLTELSGATLTDTGTLTNDGSIVLDPSALVVAGLIGSGPVAVDPGSTLNVQGTVSAGETIQFGGSGAYLALGAPDAVNGSVTNFDTDETIFLNGIDDTSVSYTDGRLTFAGGDFALALGNGGTVMASAGTDGTDVFVTLCFCANTLILTPTGERPVQELSPGDLVTTHRGEARPIVWVGVGKVLTTRGQRGAATPVIVRKGALADNVPNRDLRVTKGHAFWFGGALIPVEFLVNHRSIEWDDRAQEVSLYHVELATHDVLVANGAAAESYRDDGNRWLFRNGNSGWDLPPQAPCAPVLTGGPVVDTVWRCLLERADPNRALPLTDDPDLHLVVDGRRVDSIQRRDDLYVFRLPVCPHNVRIRSRSAVPQELGIARDSRPLGVAVRRIVLAQPRRQRALDADSVSLADGYHAFEPDNGFRWTDGDAAVPTDLFAGMDSPAMLLLFLGGATRYLDDGTLVRAA